MTDCLPDCRQVVLVWCGVVWLCWCVVVLLTVLLSLVLQVLLSGQVSRYSQSSRREPGGEVRAGSRCWSLLLVCCCRVSYAL